MGSLAVLLLISLTINTLGMIYCIYQLRVRSTQSIDEKGNEEKLYEQVDERQHPEVVAMKQNEAYGEIDHNKQIFHTTGQ